MIYITERISLQTKRLASTEHEPHALEVASQLFSASSLLWYLSATLPGLNVIAKKSWALTDDFEAYFLYKGRLFVMETPFVNIWVSLLGTPADEKLFCEIESQVQKYSIWTSFLAPFAVVRYLFVPSNPPQDLLQQHGALHDEKTC